MKYLSHLALPLLMFGLLALAFVLPKFVQEAAPEDGSIFAPSTTTPKVAPTPIRRPLINPSKTTPKIKINSGVDSVNSHPAINTSADINYDKLIPPFLTTVKDGDYGQADQMLNLLEDAIPKAVHSSLEYSLATAKDSHNTKLQFAQEKKQYEAQLSAAQKQVDAAKAAIKETLSETRAATPLTADNLPDMTPKRLPKIAAEPATNPALPVIEDSFKPSNSLGNVDLPELPLPATDLELPTDMSVKFGFNSSEVPYASYYSMDQAAEFLKKEPRIAVELRGYSDSVGNAQYNKILSEARSKQIKLNLVNRGIAEERILIKTFGASVSPTGRSANHRRVDIVFYER